MQRNDLEMEIYSNLMESEKNGKRQYLSKIVPFTNTEITENDFDYDRLSEISTKLFDLSKTGLE